MTDPLLCTEIVFGTGDLFRTGSAAGPGTLEQQWEKGGAQKNPLGPAQTDLVRIVQGSQGTMGIVTWASVKLEVKPKLQKLYFVSAKNPVKLIDFSYRALKPRLADEFFIVSSYSLASMISDQPDTINKTASSQAPFTLIYSISGHFYSPEKRVAYQEHDLAEIAKTTGVEIMRKVPGCSADKMSELIANPCPEPYFKLRPKGAFLDIFFLTTLDRVASFVSVMKASCVNHNYPCEELGLYIQPIQQGRTCHVEFTLYYDPADKKDTDRAYKIFSEANFSLSNAGAFYSRPYGPWAEIAYANCPDTVGALNKVKGILDPEGILNRGKLCFGEEK
jgi:hypothetical protein